MDTFLRFKRFMSQQREHMVAELEAEGHRCGRYRARKLMNLANIAVQRKRKFKVTTNSKHKLSVLPNLLNREFDVTDPDRTWVSNITARLDT